MKRDVVTGRIAKFSGNQVIIAVKWSEGGEPLLDIREHFQLEGAWKPMKSGVTVGLAKAKLISDAIELGIQLAGGGNAKSK